MTGSSSDVSLQSFHPAVRGWFESAFDAPTDAQTQAWSKIATGRHTLLAAPTGSGKTLAAFMTAIDQLVKLASSGWLADEVYVVYVSPLKALSNDIQLNLQAPLAGIETYLMPGEQKSLVDGDETEHEPIIRTAVRSGDTPQSERTRMIRRPPHILVTTPESLHIMATSESGRRMLSTTRTVIVDEIHAMAGSKRGAHLSLTLERLQDLSPHKINRIGLSATQDPLELVGHFLVGNRGQEPCQIVDCGHKRERDLAISMPPSPLDAVMAGEVWGQVYDQIQELIEAHTTTLIFVNTRRMAERMAKALAERLDEISVTAHHGSLAKEHRYDAEQRLKAGTLKALVATSSLELGIDIGDVDLVCQMGSPRGISAFLQRVGRSGHRLGETPKGRLFPLSRDDLVECTAVLNAVRDGQLDKLLVYPKPLDVLAQQIVSEVSGGDRSVDELFELFTRAWPYRDLERSAFDSVLQMLADGFNTNRGRRSAYLHLDAVNGTVKPRKGARLTAVTNAGTIPDQFDYDVILEPEGFKVGTLNEDFSFESLPGDIFQLGNTSYRILKVELGKVIVQDAKGQPPNIPFWFGEAPGRTDVLSDFVSSLRERVTEWMVHGIDYTREQLRQQFHLSKEAALQLADYLGAAYSALEALPTKQCIIFERFFDQAGDQHLVIHSAYGSRVNKAWGLALRKRFCCKFNFELQAAALEDTVVLSLSSTHSFPLKEVVEYLNAKTVKEVLTQALLDSPMFPTHWRWNASIALAVKRFSGGKKTPPQFQRSNAEDLVAVVFPDQIACQENITGDREIPDHPLIEQTLYDCLHDLMDIDTMEQILRDIKSGDINVLCRDLVGPSALTQEILTAKPYAFLDDAPAEERRTSLVPTGSFARPEDAASLGHLDQQVIDRVGVEAWPAVTDAEECHDALQILSCATDKEVRTHGWQTHLDQLIVESRVTLLHHEDTRLWIPAERREWFTDVYPNAQYKPSIRSAGMATGEGREASLGAIVRSRLQGLAVTDSDTIAADLGVDLSDINYALLMLEQEGIAMRGQFSPETEKTEWCDRALLARIHRGTVKSLRKQVQPVSIGGFMRFLFQWQGVGEAAATRDAEGADALADVLAQLEGVEAPAAAWESDIIPARMPRYSGQWLDQLCSSGNLRWARLSPPDRQKRNGKFAVSQSPIALVARRGLRFWQQHSKSAVDDSLLGGNAQRVLESLRRQGACFFDELLDQGGWLKAEVEDALVELVGCGLISSDSFAGYRGLQSKGRQSSLRNRGRSRISPLESAGRWSLLHRPDDEEHNWESVEYIVDTLLNRYGVLFRKLMDAENSTPSWREIHYVLRRKEARGEVRGGRFVNGFSGEQFALPEALKPLRQAEKDISEKQVCLSAADPLNLTGFILPGDRIPGHRVNRILFQDGIPVASRTSNQVNWLRELSAQEQWKGEQLLARVAKPKAARFRFRNSGIH